MRYVRTFVIDEMHELQTLKIGKNSFTNKPNSKVIDYLRSAHILNCEKLETIEIGQYSFSDYAGEFELKNLPALKTLEIGELSKSSNCFYFASFSVRGIVCIFLLIL